MAEQRYTNVKEFKVNRVIRLEEESWMCQICGNFAKIAHHRDMSKSNHSLDNLMVVCRLHHSHLHWENYSVYTRNYGATQGTLARENEVSRDDIEILHVEGKLENWLEERRVVCEINR